MQAIYTAATGMKGQQTRLDTVAANISNVNTTGYKSARLDFKDALYTAMDHPEGDSEKSNLLTGSGVLVGDTSRNFSAGTLITTGATLDFAIRGNGFFTVESSRGDILYTRSGSFGITSGGEESYLVTPEGYYVLDDKGNRIAIPEDRSALAITPDGVLSNGNTALASLGLVDFPNPEGLISAGDTCFQATEVSGRAVTAVDADVIQGSLEGSNVDLAQEMTMLIRAQRSYSLASRALQTADDMEGLANNIR